MDCRDKILSERYFDVITNFPLEILEDSIYDLCYINIDNLYYVVYVSENNIRNVSEYVFDYKAVPKLYGLMQEDVINQGYDPNNLIVSGITQVQREPLNLTGRGVVICIIIRTKCSGTVRETAVFWRSGIRRFRAELLPGAFIMVRNLRETKSMVHCRRRIHTALYPAEMRTDMAVPWRELQPEAG